MTRRIEVPDLVEALSKALRMEDDPDAWDESLIHASDLGVSVSAIPDPTERWCARSLQLRFQGTGGREATDGERLMWRQGHNLEKQMVDLWNIGLEALGQGWRVAYVQKDVSENLPGEMSGTLDVEMHGPNGELVVIDVKSKRGGAFDYLDRPKPSNVIQVQSYMMAVDADYGILFYVDREGQNFARQFEVGRNDDKVLRAYQDTQRIKYAKAPEPLVPPTYHKPRETKTKGWAVSVKLPWQCDWCPFFKGKFADGTCEGAVSPGVVDHVVGHVHRVPAFEMTDGQHTGFIESHWYGEDVTLFYAREGYEEIAEQVASAMKKRGALNPRLYVGKGEEPIQASQDLSLAARSWGANESDGLSMPPPAVSVEVP